MTDALLILARIVLFAAVLAPVGLAIYMATQSAAVRAIFKRNVASYFSGVLGYLFIVVFVVIAALAAFVPEFFTANDSTLDYLTRWLPLMLVFLAPAITMSTWAEERKQGTSELLFTLPATDLEILLAKYLSVVAVYTTVLVFSAPIPLFLEFFIGDPDWWLIATNYFGYWLAGVSLLAAGMLASALTSSVTVAFVLGAAICAIPVGVGYVNLLVVGRFGRWLGRLFNIDISNNLLGEFAISEQLRDFGLGVVPLSSLLYFASLSIFMLYLNLVVISERHWSRSKQAGMGAQYAIRTAAVAVALVSLSAIASHVPVRADMTAENLYTLSDTTRDIIGNMQRERPVTIQAFLSTEVPRDYITVKRRLTGLLRQYDEIGGGRVEVRFVDVAPSSVQADEAESLGVQPTRLVDIRDGRQFEQTVYLGVVLTSTYDEVVLPFVGPGTPIEYELTRSLRTVSNQDRMTVGILDTDANVRAGSQGFGRIVDELKKQYEVEHVSADTPIEADRFKVLIAVMPSSLTQPQMDNFVSYVREGHPVLIFDDPWPYVYDTGMGITQAPRLPKPSAGGGGMMFGMNQPPSQPKADGGTASSLLSALGIAWDNGEVVWDTFNPHKEFLERVPREFIFISPASGNRKAVNPDHAITGGSGDSPGLQEILAVFAGTIQPREQSDVKFEPLLMTSRDSGLMDWDDFSEDSFTFAGGRPTPARGLRPNRIGFTDEYAHILAGHITSKDGGRKINAVFVADADMISDWFFYQRERSEIELRLDNVEFVLNAVDVLAGDESYLALRKRRPEARPLDRFENLTRRHTQQATTALEQADKKATDDLAAIEKRFEKEREQVMADTADDPQARAQMLALLDARKTRQIDVAKAKIEQEKQREIERIRARRDRLRSETQDEIRFWAAAVSPLPALFLGIVVLAVRTSRERREIPTGRMA